MSQLLNASTAFARVENHKSWIALAAATIIMWLKPHSTVATQRGRILHLSSGNEVQCQLNDGSVGDAELAIGRDTTNINIPSDTPSQWVADEWTYLAFRYDTIVNTALADQQLWFGHLDSDAVEVSTYKGFHNEGAGTITSHTADLRIGSRNNNSAPVDADLAILAFYDRYFTDADMVRYQYDPRRDSDCRMLLDFDRRTTGGYIRDLSGNQNHAVLIGAGQVRQDLPLRMPHIRPVGRKRRAVVGRVPPVPFPPFLMRNLKTPIYRK